MVDEMKKIIGILLILILLFSTTSPVLADDGKGLKKGDKVVLDNHIVSEYLGRDIDGKYLWRATIGAPQYLDDLQTPIECKWLTNEKGEWVSGSNLFSVIVKKDKVTVEKDGMKMHWEPNIKVGNKTYKAISDEPTLLSIDPINSNYTYNTLEWDFGIAKRHLRIIEGALLEYFIFEANPGADVEIKSNLYKEGNFIWDRPPFAYDVEGKPIAISPDKVVLASEFNRDDITYPITIDPTSTFTTSSSDGYLINSGTVYATVQSDGSADYIYSGSTTLGIGQVLFEGIYIIRRGYVYFDTSGLPDGCIVSAATLKLYGLSDHSTTDFNIQIQIGSGTPPTYPHDPLVVGDYLYTQYSGNGGIFNTAGFSIMAYNSITLTADGRDWINKTGTTKFALLSSEDIGDSPPTGKEYVFIFSYERGNGFWPQLVVTYAASASPTVTTNAATYVATHTARLNSTLVDDGGEACDVRFQYYTGAGDWPDNETDWVNDTYLTGNTPWVDIDSLVFSTLYHFRVQARNDFGGGAIISGASVDFTTEATPAAPTNLKAYPGSTTVGLTWTRGVGATNTMIRYSETGYPTDQTEGTLSYLGTLASHTITGLTAGHRYYIVAIGNSGAEYSATVEVLATTTAGGAVGEEPTDPTMPTGWFQSPDHTGLSGLPLYDQMNDLFNAFDIPPESGWFFSAILVCVGLGAVVFVISRHPTPAVITLAVSLAIASLIKLLPLYMMAFTALFIIGVWQLGRES